MLDPHGFVGREAIAKFALVLAVPLDAHRDGEVLAGAFGAQPLDDGCGFGGAFAAAVPAVAEADGALQCRVGTAAEPQRDRADRLRLHRHVDDLRGDVFGLKGHRVLGPDRAHHGDTFVHTAAALIEGDAEGGEFRLQPANAGAEDQAAFRQVMQGGEFLHKRQGWRIGSTSPVVRGARAA